MDRELFLKVSKKVDESMGQVIVADTKFSVEEGRLELRERTGKEKKIGVLAPRALANLGRLTGAGPRLLLNQNEHTLNAVLRTQLAKDNELRILRDPVKPETIISIQSEKVPYISYEPALSPVIDKLAFTVGDPVNHDVVAFFIQTGEIEIAKEKLTLGCYARLSSMSVSKNLFRRGIVRIRCTNGMMDSIFSPTLSLKGFDATVVGAIVREYAEKGNEYQADLDKLISWLRKTNLDDSHLDVMSKVPAVVQKKHREVLKDPSLYRVELDKAGVDGQPKTIWDSVNILTHLAKNVPSAPNRVKIEEAAFGWARQTMKVFGKN